MVSENIFFGPRIKELREKKGLNQRQLAEKFGLQKTTVTLWENGTSTPNLAVFQALADFFGVSADYLLGRTDDPKLHKPRKPAPIDGGE